MIMPSEQSSAFAQMVDKLRGKTDEEIKLLYNNFFATELNNGWQNLTATADFSTAKEDDIIKAIQGKRYHNYLLTKNWRNLPA